MPGVGSPAQRLRRVFRFGGSMPMGNGTAHGAGHISATIRIEAARIFPVGADTEIDKKKYRARSSNRTIF